MSRQSFWQHLYAYPIVRIFLIGVVAGLTVSAVSYFLPPTYRSESRLVLDIDDHQLNNYQLSELAKREAQVAKNYFEGKDFLRLALAKAGKRFQEEELERKWVKRFKIEVPATGATLRILTFGSSPQEAQRLNQAAIDVLRNQVKTILTLKDQTEVSLKVLENPSLDNTPVAPQPWLYGLIAFFAVLFVATLYYIY